MLMIIPILLTISINAMESISPGFELQTPTPDCLFIPEIAEEEIPTFPYGHFHIPENIGLPQSSNTRSEASTANSDSSILRKAIKCATGVKAVPEYLEVRGLPWTPYLEHNLHVIFPHSISEGRQRNLLFLDKAPCKAISQHHWHESEELVKALIRYESQDELERAHKLFHDAQLFAIDETAVEEIVDFLDHHPGILVLPHSNARRFVIFPAHGKIPKTLEGTFCKVLSVQKRNWTKRRTKINKFQKGQSLAFMRAI